MQSCALRIHLEVGQRLSNNNSGFVGLRKGHQVRKRNENKKTLDSVNRTEMKSVCEWTDRKHAHSELASSAVHIKCTLHIHEGIQSVYKCTLMDHCVDIVS